MPLPHDVVVAGHRIPAGTKCYCVVNHYPAYAHVLPYELPNGQILYLCPTSHQALTLYMALAEQNNGVPVFDNKNGWSLVVQRLGQLLWAVKSQNISVDQYMRLETFRRLSKEVDKL
jgi:hypothetical protein